MNSNASLAQIVGTEDRDFADSAELLSGATQEAIEYSLKTCIPDQCGAVGMALFGMIENTVRIRMLEDKLERKIG